MTLVIQFIPNAVESIVSSLKRTADKIRDTANKVKVNKYQCTRLSERIDIIVGFYQRESSSSTTKIRCFQKFLQRCLHFINKFVKTGWLMRILQNDNYDEQFQQFNKELIKHCQDLNFGFMSNTLHLIFSAEDAEDVKNDFQEIVEIVRPST